MEPSWPILEFDATTDAMIQPDRVIRRRDVAERCVLCFFQEVIASLRHSGKAHQVAKLRSEIGVNPVYEIVLHDERLTVVHPGVGAPLAAAFLEEAIALGCTKFMACGGAGVLASEIAMGHVVVPLPRALQQQPPVLPARERNEATMKACRNRFSVQYPYL